MAFRPSLSSILCQGTRGPDAPQMKGREAVCLSCPGGAREGWWSGQGSRRNVCKLKLCPRSGSQVSASVSYVCLPQQTLTLHPSCLSPAMNGPTVGNPKGGWEGIAAQALSPHPLPPAIQPLPDVAPTLGFLNLDGWVRWGLPGPDRGPGGRREERAELA